MQVRLGVILQKPESRPTTKRLESLLKVTERAACSLGDSMTGRVFMMGDEYAYVRRATEVDENR